MTKLATNSRHNNTIGRLNGVQVVGGSNPPTPTINLASKSPPKSSNPAVSYSDHREAQSASQTH